jgi:pectate lyase
MKLLSLVLFLSLSSSFAQTGSSADPLWSQLEGFGKATTGGKDGVVYKVTTLQDNAYGKPLIAGSLRYGIAMSDPKKKLWIVFDNKFKDGVSHGLWLQQRLYLRSDLTLDGRGADIVFKTTVDWNLYELFQTKDMSRPACRPKGTLSSDNMRKAKFGTMLAINGVKNVIVTNFSFRRDNYKIPFVVKDLITNQVIDESLVDKECLGDIISIASLSSTQVATNIWINKNSLTQCGDGCIDMTHGAPDKASLVSVSNNFIYDADKVMLAGGGTDYQSVTMPVNFRNYRVSMYRNHFRNSHQRMPRATNAVVHSYNNFFQNFSVIVGAYDSKVFMEENLLKNDIKRYIAKDPDQLYLSQNRNVGVELTPTSDLVGYVAYREAWTVAAAPYRITPAVDLSPASFATAGNR